MAFVNSTMSSTVSLAPVATKDMCDVSNTNLPQSKINYPSYMQTKPTTACTPNRTKSYPAEENRFAGLGPVVPTPSFRVRLVTYPNRPTKEVVKEDGSIEYVYVKKVNVSNRLDALRQMCNIPKCRFNRLPKAVIRTLGCSFTDINKAIDNFLQGSVGATPVTSVEPDEVIQGMNNLNVGYVIKKYHAKGLVDIFCRFGGYVADNYQFKVRLQYFRTNDKDVGNFRVYAHVCYNKKVTAPYCSDFNLFGKNNNRQFNVIVLVASILGMFPDYSELVGIYYGKAFRSHAPKAISNIRTNHSDYCQYVRFSSNRAAKVGVLPTQKVYRPKPVLPSVEYKVDDRGVETFVVKYNNGSQKIINNDYLSVANLFNATLIDKSYILHPKCRVGHSSRLENHKDQFCWVEAFAMAGMRMPRGLIPYPEMKIAYLVRCGLEKVLFRHCKEVGPKLYHFDRKFNVMNKKMPYGSWVGVKGDMNIPNISRNIDMLFDDLVGNVLEQTSLKADNLLLSNIVNRLSDRVNRMCERKKELSIRVTLDSNQKRKLSNLFPELTMEFEDSSYSSHALFTAMRTCENYILHKRCNNQEFIDVGGDVITLLNKQSRNVHICCPSVDVKDAHRQMTRSNILDRMRGFDESVTVCDKLTQDCTVPSPNMVAVQVYDMSLHDMGKAMLSHKSKRFDFSVIIPPEICEDQCDVYLFNDSLRVTVNGDKVNYEYGSSGECYVHDLDNLKSILRTQIFVVDGHIFKKTLECSREQLHFYSVVPCVNMKSGVYELTSHYSKSRTDKIDMLIPVKEFAGGIKNVRVSVDKHVTMHLIEYAMNTTMKVEDKSAEYLISQFRSRKSVSISGGKVVQKEFDLPLDLYPGYIAIILAEGARLREKVVNMARISYFRHYAPTVVQIMFNLFYELYNIVKRGCYKTFVNAMKCFLSDEFIEKILIGEKRIFDNHEVVHFKQEIHLVGKPGNMSVLQDALHKFTVSNERYAEDLAELINVNKSNLPDDEYDEAVNLFSTGGGVRDFKFKLAVDHCTFRFYQKIWSFVSKFVKDSKRVSLITNFIVSVRDFFSSYGNNTWDYIRNVFLSILNFVRNGALGPFPKFWSEIKVAAKSVKQKIIGNSEEMQYLLEQFFRFKTGMDSDGNEIFWQELTNNLGTKRLFTEEQPSKFQKKIRSSVACVKHYVKTSQIFIRDVVMWLRFLFVEFKKSFEGDNLINTTSNLIEGMVYFVTHTLYLLGVGNFSIVGLISAISAYVGIKLTGIEKKYLGHAWVTKHLISATTVSSPSGVLGLPVRAALTKCLEFKLKEKLVKYPKLQPVMQDIVAKDALSLNWYKHVTPYRVRMVLYTSLILIVYMPKLALALMIFAALVGEHKKYLEKVAVMTNVNLSFASVLNRTNPTNRAKTLKSLLKSKFMKKKMEEINEEGEGIVCDKYSADDLLGEESLGNAEDVEVEFDYDGSYVERNSRLSTSKLIVPDPSAVIVEEGLNFHDLQLVSKDYKMVVNVPFKISAAILQFTHRDVPTMVYTGDEKLDSVNEYYYLEKKKVFLEFGKINNVVDAFQAFLGDKSDIEKVVYHLRQRFDDATLYVSDDGIQWFKLKLGSKSWVNLDHKCKYSRDRVLLPFSVKLKGFQVTSEELAGMYSNERCLSLEILSQDIYPKLTRDLSSKVKFFNKPPGAGKTTTIVNEFARLHKEGNRCLALTCTKAGKLEIINKLKKLEVTNVASCCMTYDSFLMKNLSKDIDYVFCDEIFMIHAGLWLALTCNMTFKQMSCYGDVNQIPYINRVPNTVCTKSMSHFLTYEMFHDNVSYRCPVDVCKLLSSLTDVSGNLLYPRGVYPVGENAKVLRSMTVAPIYSVDDVVDDTDLKIVTFTQPEKEEMIKATRQKNGLSSSVNTVNEVQGGTFEKVDVFRLKPYDNPIYSDINQFVVSVSRHTQLMRYRVVSSKMNDKIATNISSLDTISDFVLKEFAAKRRV
nr:polyprotein 1a [Sweet potato chlorotic stunt virus]